MSRAVVLACLCALPIAVLARQAEAARTLAATLDEMDRPGAIDPVETPRDALGETLLRSASTVGDPHPPSWLDGLPPVPRLEPGDPRAIGLLRASSRPALPPPSTLRRLSRLQVFRN